MVVVVVLIMFGLCRCCRSLLFSVVGSCEVFDGSLLLFVDWCLSMLLFVSVGCCLFCVITCCCFLLRLHGVCWFCCLLLLVVFVVVVVDAVVC